MASKSPRIKIMLLSTGKNEQGKDTGFFYTTYLNPRNTTEKLERMKFDPRAYNPKIGRAGMKVLFKQKKIPK